MSRTSYFLLSRILLNFEARGDDVIKDLSAGAFSPDGNLWLGSDEMVAVECLSPIGSNSYGHHQRFLIQDYIELFNIDDEIDIEGMDYSEGYLWLTGSHSNKRKKVKGKQDAEDLDRLATITTDLNRFILARIPVIEGELVKSYSPVEGEKLTAACLETTEKRNILFEILKADRHLQPFISAGIPAKDNGLDIEGLAVVGNKLFLGLRGPVLRGWAIILELQIESIQPGILTLKHLTEEAKYKKHFFDLNGLGIRELCIRGEDMIILAGPTMDLEGEMQVFCWQKALKNLDDLVHSQDNGDLVSLFDLPFTIGSDHAEGLALYSYLEADDSLMVFYDSPDQQRLRQEKQIFVDVFRL
ncbi:DUF3616 domain-containing protein [Pleurocapsa sp. CCALA 161]|uniref:DUF3616 domain-containing protein n=1 Tax=Pleurocapsa sp. CCALA 161 TaxID=2107688 RepID=UPI000D057456|nr:DUF3616 domain-containing protein [Pleurocapsa sp. CCALA 161]PSB08814.1 DUF3616 domain-containing protein [Pleurocapsa sp. CCALA 161]